MLVTDRTFASTCEKISRQTEATIDHETSGLHPWLGDYIAGTAVYVDGDGPAYFPFRHGEGPNLPAGSQAKLNDALRGKVIHGWNVRFDLTFSHYAGADWALGATVRDGIIDAVLLDENHESYSLESAAERTLGAGGGASKRKMDARLAELFPKVRSASGRKALLHKLPAHEVEEYACWDVMLPPQIDFYQRAEIRRQGLE